MHLQKRLKYKKYTVIKGIRVDIQKTVKNVPKLYILNISTHIQGIMFFLIPAGKPLLIL